MSEPVVPPGPPAGAPPPPPPSSGGAVSPNRGLMIVLSYLGLLAFIPLLTEKDDKEVQWHAKHGIVLMVAELILFVAIFVVQMAMAFIDFGCTGCLLFWVALIGVMVVHVLCIVKGINGERLLIPQISQFADRF